MLRIIYDMLFWAQELPVGGRQQPILVVIDEATSLFQMVRILQLTELFLR